MTIEIKDYGPRKAPEGEPMWTTETLQDDFEVHGFAMGYVVVTRRADGVKGSMQFTHHPRLYFGFVAAS